jgi:Ca-activated chloride channel homolog
MNRTVRIVVSSIKVVLVIAILLSTASAQEETSSFHRSQVGAGELLHRCENSEVPLPVMEIDIQLDVIGPLISGSVCQRFHNPTDEVIEAIYLLPLPENAAVHTMEMCIGDRRIISVVQEKAEARRTYEHARESGRRAALSEGERANLFTTSVANILPGEEITIELTWLGEATFSDGVFSLAFPLTMTPRYIPPRQIAHEEATRISPPFVPEGAPAYPTANITIHLEPGMPVEVIESLSHDMDVTQEGDRWTVTPRGGTVPADRDVLLSWRPVTGRGPWTATFVEDREDGRYVLLMVVPDAADTSPAVSTETLFVLDVSGSMQGPSIAMARQALIEAVDKLTPDDRFNLMAFNSDSRLFRNGFLDGTHEWKGVARQWIAGLDADGGTNLHPAILRAATQFLIAESDTGRGRRIVLITDAAIGNEAQLLTEVAGGLGDVSLHVVGVGSAPNRYLVEQMASLGGGLSGFVAAGNDAGSQMSTFLTRINRPSLIGPSLEWKNAPPIESHPERLTALFPGELLLWSGRFQPESEIVGRFLAQAGEQTLSQHLSPSTTSEHKGIATRWAREKITALMAEHYRGQPEAQLEILSTAIRFGLITPFTSRVAVEYEVVTDEAGRTHRLANGLPSGSRLMAALPSGGERERRDVMVGVMLLLTGLVMAGVQRRRLKSEGSS